MSDTINIGIAEQTISLQVQEGAISPAPTAENDFLIGSSALTWVRKTLAQVKTILGLKSAAYTESTDYAAASHTHTQSQVTAVAFQDVVFANPLFIDASTNKDFSTTITGDTMITLLSYLPGDSGMIQVNIGGAGGHAITFDSAFNHRLGETTFTGNVLNETYYISWRAHSALGIVYTIDKVQT